MAEARGRIDRSINSYDNPTKSGNTQASGESIRKSKDEFLNMLEQMSVTDPKSNAGMLSGVKELVRITETMLDDTKGAVLANTKSPVTDELLKDARKVASTLMKEMDNFTSGDSSLSSPK